METVSKVKYGQEIGPNLIKIAKHLLRNQELCSLLVNTDLDPLNLSKHPNPLNTIELLHKNILVVPLIPSNDETTESKLVLMFTNSVVSGNTDNENLTLDILVYCPLDEWLISGNTLRPFAIMSEIRKSLQGTRINGLGEIKYNGFSASDLTMEMSCHSMEFAINVFS